MTIKRPTVSIAETGEPTRVHVRFTVDVVADGVDLEAALNAAADMGDSIRHDPLEYQDATDDDRLVSRAELLGIDDGVVFYLTLIGNKNWGKR